MIIEKIKDINQGDLLTFIAVDGNYKVLLCTNTNKIKSPHNFTFCALTYNSIEKPTIEIIQKSGFFGVGNTTKNNFYEYTDNELEKMWASHPEIKPYLLGSYNFIIWKKNFLKFHDNFEFIGNLKIVNNIDKNGNGVLNASNWDYLKAFFNEKFNEVMSEKGQKTFELISIIKD